MNQSIVDLYST